MTARDSAFQALHNLSGAKWLPIEALVRRLRKFGFSDRWASDTAQEWYREFGRGSKTVDAPVATSSPGAPPLECTCEEERSKSCPIHGACPECGDFIEDGPCSCKSLGRCQCREAVGCCDKDAVRLILVPLAEGRPGVKIQGNPRAVVAYCELCASHAEKGEPCGDLPGSDVHSCFCGRAVQEAGDFCSQACRTQAMEE